MYKVIHGLVPEYMILQTENNELVQRYNLRAVSDSNVYLPRANTNFLKKSFHFSAVKIWNDLPCSLKNCANLNLFKSNCLEHFLKL